MTARWIIGLASGSSADGVDAALVEIEGVGLEMRARLMQALHQPYGIDLRELIRRAGAAQPGELGGVRQIALLHRLLGETFTAAARMVADHASLSLKKVQCIACPGQTVWHDVEGRFPSTLALGMASVVAERLGVTTVSDFRARDLAAGGQGIPLETLTDYLIFRHPQEHRLLIHLGGLARVVYLPANCKINEILGFEASPCNLLLDTLMRHLTNGRESYDAGGKHAVQGKCLEALVQNWLAHPWLQRRPPKSLSRQQFEDDFAAQAIHQARQIQGSLHDLLCTATHFVARSITGALKRFLPAQPRPTRVLLSGGGVRNGLLWHLLQQQITDSFRAGASVAPLGKTDEVGIPAQICKAMSFALLAALTVDGVAGNVPAATGAAGSRLLGSLTPGSSTNWARCLAWMAAQTAPLTFGPRE
jgi:anhydro-N-acetylmuramic acid kinase